MITPEDIQTRIVAGVAALDAGDHAAALTAFEAAAALMGGSPIEVEIAGHKAVWKPESLDAVIERTRRNLRKSNAGGAKITQTPIERVRG